MDCRIKKRFANKSTIPLGIADSGIFVVVVAVVIDTIVAPRILSHPKKYRFSEYDYDNDNDNDNDNDYV